MRRAPLGRLLGLVVAGIVLTTAVSCDWEGMWFKRSPRVKLVLSERSDDVSIWAPVVGPSGNEFYYLRSPGESNGHGFTDMAGELWKASIDGSHARLVTAGSFGAFALSPDGSRLALTTCTKYLLLADYEGRILDTLARRQTGTLWGVWFSRRDTQCLFYAVDGLYFTVNLDGSETHEVPVDSIDGFPWVQPSGQHTVITRSSESQWDLGVVDAQTGDTTMLHTSPYRHSWTHGELACWTPDEDAVVFTAFEWQEGDPNQPTPSEIWKYQPVFDR